jgi:hypothetical protein
MKMKKGRKMLAEGRLREIVRESVDRLLHESVEMYGRTMLTYDDIPRILDGEIPYRDGSYNDEKWYVLRLPNGRYVDYLCRDEDREETVGRILSRSGSTETRSESQMVSWLRFNLHDRQEAEEWLLGREICSMLEGLGYETDMWSQLGKIGGIEATRDGKTVRVAGAYPHKEELISIIERIRKNKGI